MNVESTANTHLNAIKQLCDRKLIVWSQVPSPKPNAMRALVGRAHGYLLNVCQANVKDQGVLCEGMVICSPDGLIIHLPKELSDYLYHAATAERN